jgi:predicted nucleotidyltransferase component of viral defense system
MIPAAHLQAWAEKAPWPDPRQIEQDLIICRALCELFGAEALKGKIAFRGGTAINKLLFAKPLRYSEDIDLVQPEGAPIKDTLGAIRDTLGWLECRKVATKNHSTQVHFLFAPEANPDERLRLKIEINGRDHGALYGFKTYPFAVENPWFTGKADIISFGGDELFSTKLRAFLQRDKSRDLFDLREGLTQLGLDPTKVIQGLAHYLAKQELSVSRANAEETMLRKLRRSLTEDIAPLLPSGVAFTDEHARAAFGLVWHKLVALIEGESWKKSATTIEALRERFGEGFLAQ